MDEVPDHRVIINGHAYMTVFINPTDAGARGIRNGDIIKVYNDRGAVLCVAKVTERMRPGVVRAWSSVGKYDPLEPGKPYSVDRGGCMNILTPERMQSKNVSGMSCNSCLVEIKRWEV